MTKQPIKINLGMYVKANPELMEKTNKKCKICEEKAIFGLPVFALMDIYGWGFDKTINEIDRKNIVPFEKDQIQWESCTYCKMVEKNNINITEKLKKTRKRFGKFENANFNDPKGKQQFLFEKIQSKQYTSYFLFGVPGTYKTYGMYACINSLLESGLIFNFHNYSGNVLVQQLRRYDQGDDNAFNSQDILNIGIPDQEIKKKYYYLIIDDLDKVKFSSFNIKELYIIIDTIFMRGDEFQFFITSNKSFDDLKNEWIKEFPDIENTILSLESRIIDKCGKGHNIINFNF